MAQEEIDIVTELESEEARRVVGDGKHQFDEHGLRYEKRRHLIIWLLIFVVAAISLGYFLLYTETGKDLLNLNSNEQGNNNFPVSYNFSSSGSSSSSENSATNSDSGSDATRELLEVPDREFTDKPAEQVLQEMQDDISEANNYAEESVIFEDFYPKFEMGVTPNKSKS